MMKFKRIKEVFPTWKTTGAIFAELATRDVPWAGSFSARAIGLDYYGNFSGNKIISSLIENILPSDGVLTSEEITILCDVIMGLYSMKWGKLWETMQLDYNPIENYNMVEQMIDDETVKDYGKNSTRTDNLTNERTDNLTSQRTDNLTHEKSGYLEKLRTDNLSEQRTDNLTHGKTGTETETPNTTTQDDNSVFGFNSGNAVPSDSRTIQNTGTNQKTYNTQETDTGTQTRINTGNQSETDSDSHTETDTGTQTETDTGTQTNRETGTQSFVDSGTDTETRNYRLTRSGNIGVTTSQQMIESERELWRVWNFFRGIVYPDIDRVLTIEIY